MGLICACLISPYTHSLISPRSVRQAAVVFLKNAVARGYKLSNTGSQPQISTPPIPDADKQVIKQHILPLIVASPNRAIRIQLAAVLKTLVSHDFPEKWPGFMDNVIQLLQSDRPESVFGGMTALLEIFKTYRFVGLDLWETEC